MYGATTLISQEGLRRKAEPSVTKGVESEAIERRECSPATDFQEGESGKLLYL